MTGQIINIHGDAHRDVLALLPWHVTGQLDVIDTARVEAHLEDCAACRTALDMERRLDRELVREPASVDQGWAVMRHHLERNRPATAPATHHGSGSTAPQPARALWMRWPLRWRLSAPLALASAAGLLLLQFQMPVRFAALGRAPTAPAGNMVVIFRPDTSEAIFRQTLRSSEARLVDGPTAANAYVLLVPAEDRTAQLERLRRQPQVLLAEPVDAGQQP